MRLTLRTHAFCLALALLSSAWRADAADKKPLPASVVQTTDGAPLSLDQAGPEARVYIYVLPESTVSQRLLAAIHDWQLSAPDRVTIIVGGARDTARAFAAVDRGLQSAQWLVDADRAAWKDLQLTGVPTLVGVKAGFIEWRLAGVLNNPAALKGVVASWIATP